MMFFACKISYLFWVFVWPYCRASSPTESRLLWNPLTRDTMWSSGETDQERGQPWQSHWSCYGVYCPEIFCMLVFLPAGVAEPVGARRFWLKLLQNKFFGSGSFCPDPDRTFFSRVRIGKKPDPWKKRQKTVCSSTKICLITLNAILFCSGFS